MQNPLFFIVVSALLAFTACDKNAGDGLTFQSHSVNEMMALMHDMLYELEALPTTDDPDEDFALMMHHHHEGAITMAEMLLEKGDDATLKQIATDMMAKQRAEQTELMQFVESHAAHLNKPEYTAEIVEIMEHLNGDKDTRPLTGDADHDFAVLMLPHHESAIDMAEALLEYGEDAVTRQLARQMIDDQKVEIHELQEWLIANKPY
jgi:uncharacterized protein (DUF305 family)